MDGSCTFKRQHVHTQAAVQRWKHKHDVSHNINTYTVMGIDIYTHPTHAMLYCNRGLFGKSLVLPECLQEDGAAT
jgi:hypothetical protein